MIRKTGVRVCVYVSVCVKLFVLCLKKKISKNRR